jgi:hypothetical protein
MRLSRDLTPRTLTERPQPVAKERPRLLVFVVIGLADFNESDDARTGRGTMPVVERLYSRPAGLRWLIVRRRLALRRRALSPSG